MSVTVHINAKDNTKAGFNSVNKGLKKLSRTAKLVGVALAGIGIKGILEFAKFDDKVRDIGTLLGDVTDKDIKKLGNEIKKTAISYGQSLDSMAKARYDIISAGFKDASDSALLMAESAKLALGGGVGVDVTSNALVKLMNAYQLKATDAADVSDILFTTVKSGITTMEELAASIGTVAGTANTAHLGIADLGVAMGVLTAGGMSNTAEAAVALRGALIALSAPTSVAAKAMKAAGVEVKYFEDGNLDLYKTIEQFQGLELDQMRAFIPDVRAANAIQTMANNIDKLGTGFEDMSNRAGVASDAMKIKMDGLQFKINQIKVKMDAVLSGIGEKLVMVAGNFLSLESSTRGAFIALAAAITGIGVALYFAGAAAWPWIGIAAGIIIAVYALWKGWKVAWNGIVNVVKTAWEIIKNVFSFLKSGITLVVGLLTFDVDKIKKGWDEVAEGAKVAGKNIIKNLQDGLNKDIGTGDMVASIKKDFASIGEYFTGNSLKVKVAPVLGAPEDQAKRHADPNLEIKKRIAEGEQAITKASLAAEIEMYNDFADELTGILDDVQIDYAAMVINTINTTAQYVNQVASLFDNLYALKKANIENELNDQITASDKSYEIERDRLIKFNTIQGELTEKGKKKLFQLEQRHESRISNLKEQAHQKEIAAAKFMKTVKIAQAISNTAVEVTKTLSQPWLAALIAATGAAEVAVIAAQPYASGTSNARNGSDTVPAILTPGEAVIPAPIVRENLPAVQQLVGGQTINNNGGASTMVISPQFNISAIDSQAVADFVDSDDFKQSFLSAINDEKIRLNVNNMQVQGAF